MTSPVERISGPRVAAPGKRSAGNTASFAHAREGVARSGSPRAASPSPSSSRTACSTSDARRLGDEGHGARRPRVRLEHVEPVVVHGELEVDQAARAETGREPGSDLADLLLERLAHGWARQHARRVARVDSNGLDVLEHGCDPGRAAVTERVDVELERALEVPVDEARPLDVQLAGRVRDVHAASADHVVRPHGTGIADAAPRPLGLVDVGRLPHCGAGAGKLGEAATVLGGVDGLERVAEQRHAGCRKRGRERSGV